MTQAKNKRNKRHRARQSMPVFGGFMPMMPMMMPMDDSKYKVRGRWQQFRRSGDVGVRWDVANREREKGLGGGGRKHWREGEAKGSEGEWGWFTEDPLLIMNE